MKHIIAADLFCGAGGTSSGLYEAANDLGLQVDLLAINHWSIAIATHAKNHPSAIHRCESIDGINPREAVPGGRLDLLVASPECMHHSRARGGRPINDQSRASAWHVLRWAEALDIRNILVENVPEFQQWGPLDDDGNAIKRKQGKVYLAFLSALRSLGYSVSARVLTAADYGDPTTRRRLFILARKGKRVTWPEPTHISGKTPDMFGQRKPWKPAREIIDWTIPGESIFDRKRPLAETTMNRIMVGVKKFTSQAFIVALNHGKDDQRSYSIDNPFPTVTSVDAWGLVQPFIVKYYGSSLTASLDDPLDTVTSRDHFGLVIPVSDHGAVDILFRMLQPHELAKAMSFPDDYLFTGNREQKVKQIGNAVPVLTATALCRSLLA